MRVAAVQMASSGDREANRSRVTAAVRDAGAVGADLVVFPEAVQCSFGAAGSDLSPLAEDLDGPFVSSLSTVATETGTTVIAGMFERSPVPGKVWNTLVVVDASGLRAAYRKLHLYDALGWLESDQVVAGEVDAGAGDGHLAGTVVVPIGDLQIGLMTCYDLRFPEMARVLVDQGATLLVVPAHWLSGPGKADAWSTLLRARAMESTTYVVGAAAPAPVCAGGSAVIDPMGEVLASRGPTGEGSVVAEVDAGRVTRARALLPLLEHRRFSIVRRN